MVHPSERSNTVGLGLPAAIDDEIDLDVAKGKCCRAWVNPRHCPAVLLDENNAVRVRAGGEDIDDGGNRFIAERRERRGSPRS